MKKILLLLILFIGFTQNLFAQRYVVFDSLALFIDNDNNIFIKQNIIVPHAKKNIYGKKIEKIFPCSKLIKGAKLVSVTTLQSFYHDDILSCFGGVTILGFQKNGYIHFYRYTPMRLEFKFQASFKDLDNKFSQEMIRINRESFYSRFEPLVWVTMLTEYPYYSHAFKKNVLGYRDYEIIFFRDGDPIHHYTTWVENPNGK